MAVEEFQRIHTSSVGLDGLVADKIKYICLFKYPYDEIAQWLIHERECDDIFLYTLPMLASPLYTHSSIAIYRQIFTKFEKYQPLYYDNPSMVRELFCYADNKHKSSKFFRFKNPPHSNPNVYGGTRESYWTHIWDERYIEIMLWIVGGPCIDLAHRVKSVASPQGLRLKDVLRIMHLTTYALCTMTIDVEKFPLVVAASIFIVCRVYYSYLDWTTELRELSTAICSLRPPLWRFNVDDCLDQCQGWTGRIHEMAATICALRPPAIYMDIAEVDILDFIMDGKDGCTRMDIRPWKDIPEYASLIDNLENAITEHLYLDA